MQGVVIPKSIDVIWFIVKGDDGEEIPRAQALRFPVKNWTASEAREWLKNNGIKCQKFEPAKEEESKSDMEQLEKTDNIKIRGEACYVWEGDKYHNPITQETLEQLEKSFRPGIPVKAGYHGYDIKEAVGRVEKVWLDEDSMYYEATIFDEQVKKLLREGIIVYTSIAYDPDTNRLTHFLLTEAPALVDIKPMEVIEGLANDKLELFSSQKKIEVIEGGDEMEELRKILSELKEQMSSLNASIIELSGKKLKEDKVININEQFENLSKRVNELENQLTAQEIERRLTELATGDEPKITANELKANLKYMLTLNEEQREAHFELLSARPPIQDKSKTLLAPEKSEMSMLPDEILMKVEECSKGLGLSEEQKKKLVEKLQKEI